MRLTHFSYGKIGWKIKNLIPLQQVNLLVGKNAVGKSRTIHSLGDIIAFLLQQKEPSKYENSRVVLNFKDNDKTFYYEFLYLKGEVVQESLAVNGEDILHRTKDTETGIVTATLHGEPINPPANKLILHVRRDTVQYPYIEKIMQWAEQACGLSFNEIDMAGDNETSFSILGQQQRLFTLVESMPQEALDCIIAQAQELSYPLQKIETLSLTDTIKKVVFHEKDVDNLLIDALLSKGMFRTLYLLIYMKYLSLQKQTSLLLIDDLCEGLDYDRSTKLGKLVFDFCLEHGIQLVASSNDTFLMDVIDLKYWNILQREGSRITSINIQNNPELFEGFRFTGLSNFDFISSDYIQRHLPKASENE